MPTPQDQSFADAVICLRLADRESVAECMKTVVDGEARSLAEAMVQRGVIERGAADRVLRETGGSALPPAAEEEQPAISGYEILEKLGEGGMGTVWKAHQTSLNRPVAIKILSPVFSMHRNLTERFRREALATAKLNHPNIVTAIDVGVERRPGGADLHYFVMEYVEGRSLEDVIAQEGPMDPVRAAEMAGTMASALEYAWNAAGIIHRDIKPANILVTSGGVVKVTDLGLARSTWDSAHLTTAGLAIGTPHYVSPEQAQGKPEVDARSDIYSLGATLFHMLTGRTPFSGESAAAVMAKHINEDPPFCSDVNPSVPPTIAAVVGKMMQRNPADRYQSYAELSADLERFRHGDRPVVYSRLLDASEVGTLAFSSRPPEIFTAARAFPRRRKTPKPRHLLHATGALLLLAAAAYAVWHLAGGAPPVPYANSFDLWFHVTSPDAVVGANGSFPADLTPASRLRCHVKARDAGYVFLVLVTNEAPGSIARCRTLAPNPAALAPGALVTLPGADGAYPIRFGQTTAAVFALVTARSMAPDELTAGLDRLNAELSESGEAVLPALPRGRTLWYGEGGWTAPGLDPSARRAVACLNAVCEGLREVFRKNPAVIRAAAARCSAE